MTTSTKGINTMNVIIARIGAHPTVAFAASELARYLSLIDSTLFVEERVYDSYDSKISGALWVGLDGSVSPTPDTDEISINIENGAGRITASNERSVLIAVYRLLFELGCRFLFPGKNGEVIPKVRLDEKSLTVLVSDKVRMVLAKEASNLTNGAKLVKANEKCVQDCVVVNNAGQRATFNFSELPASDYTIWVLSRMNTNDVVARISRNSRNYELTVVMPDGTLVPAVTGINSGNELFKARYGKGKGRFRWDARLYNDHNKYP